MSGSGPAQATATYRARFEECGPDATLRAGALLRWAQDMAWIHSERLGFGREWYAARGLGWVVRGLQLVMLAPIPMGADAAVTTRVGGFRKVIARRRTDVVLADGTLAAWLHTDWVMTDTVRGVPTRVPDEFPALFAAPPGGFQPVRVDPPASPTAPARLRLTVRPQELDPMAHVNNAVYVDWLEEALLAGGGAAALAGLPREYRLEYLLSAAPGQEVVAETWPDGHDETWYHVLRDAGAADGHNGIVLFKGAMTNHVEGNASAM